MSYLGFELGERVYWNDPDDGLTSGYGAIIILPDTDYEENDGIITLAMDSGSEVECLVNEIENALDEEDVQIL